MSKAIKERWKKEVERATIAVSERGAVDSKGLITEKSLEIFQIPRIVSEIELFSLADELNCLFEAITAVFMMETREREARTGANLYVFGLGFLIWDAEWNAMAKMKVWRLHQKLKAGCQDDLDFVIKLAYCFWQAEEKSEELARKWADYYFVNYEIIKKILDDVKDLFETRYRIEVEGKESRNLNPQFLERVRIAMISVWPERIVNLKQGECIAFLAPGKTKIGVISSLCAGNWQKEKQAIVAIAIEDVAIVNNYPQRVPIASFMVQLPGQERTKEQASLFPEQILIESFTKEKGETLSLGKKKGDALEVKIHKVYRDPVGRRGWIVVQTQEGFEIPVEMSEMSFSPLGPGLERIEGQTLVLIVKDVDKDGFPQLSNIDKIIEDLKIIREEIIKSERATKISERNFIERPGFVVEINEEEEKAVVIVLSENGVLHSFEVAQTYVPGGDLKNLQINQEVIVSLFRRTDKDEIPLEYLTDEEIRSKPKEWKIQAENGKLLVPFCLEEEVLKDWSARSEVIDLVRRHSWQYSLNARIRVNFEARAEISWSPLQNLRNPSVYNERAIAGRFIGRGGANIKKLIGEEKVNVNIQGLKITIQAPTSVARDNICQKISGWFKEELAITIKWNYF